MKKREVLLDAIGDVRDEMIDDAHAPVRIRRFTVKRAFVLAAALVMCFALAVTGMAAADVGVMYDALYRVSPEIAQRLKPVRMSCESSGIRMEVLSANVTGTTAEVYVSLQDMTGDRLDASVDLFDSYAIRSMQDFAATCRQISYDVQEKQATFLIEIESREAITGDKITFSADCFLSGKQEFEGRLNVDLSAVGDAVQTQTDSDVVLRGGDIHACDKFLLHDREAEFSPTEGVWFTGIGYLDGLLHTQLLFEDIHETDNHGHVYLVDAAGTRIESDAEWSHWGDGSDSYEEQVFDIAPEALAQCELWGRFIICDTKIDGDWEVTFPIAAAK